MKYTLIAAVMATSALIAAPAGAADLRVSNPTATSVHISLTGKSADQLASEINAAAKLVCGDRTDFDHGCFDSAVADANDQVSAINAAQHRVARADVDVERDGPDTIRLSLKGKSRAQLEGEIAAAARTVCSRTTAGGAEFSLCVDAATLDAKEQLGALAQLSPDKRFSVN